MSKDIEPERDEPGENRILLVSTGEQYWLLLGEDHIQSMLAGRDEHPRPVLCIVFETIIELQTFLPEGVTVHALWAINPAIVDRMRRQGELVERPDPGT